MANSLSLANQLTFCNQFLQEPVKIKYSLPEEGHTLIFYDYNEPKYTYTARNEPKMFLCHFCPHSTWCTHIICTAPAFFLMVKCSITWIAQGFIANSACMAKWALMKRIVHYQPIRTNPKSKEKSSFTTFIVLFVTEIFG